VQYRITPKRIFAGLALSALFALQTVGNVTSGRWPVPLGFLFGFVGVLIAFGVAFTARLGRSTAGSQSPGGPITSDENTPMRQFRNKMFLWVVSVLVLLALFKVLDTFDVNWRQYLGR
jgi:hypothetical protein